MKGRAESEPLNHQRAHMMTLNDNLLCRHEDMHVRRQGPRVSLQTRRRNNNRVSRPTSLLQ